MNINKLWEGQQEDWAQINFKYIDLEIKINITEMYIFGNYKASCAAKYHPYLPFLHQDDYQVFIPSLGDHNDIEKKSIVQHWEAGKFFLACSSKF